jgi:hypothetical protein
MEKFFGVKYHGRFQAHQAFEKSKEDERTYRSMAENRPELTTRAIERCKSKKIALTHSNIIMEAAKILRE